MDSGVMPLRGSAVCALVATLAGCGPGPVGPAIREDPAAMTGHVVALNVQMAITRDKPSIHVKEKGTDECGVVFAFDSGTVLRRRVTEEHVVAAAISEFRVGTRVRVWTDVVAESCPAQGIAHIAEILP